MASDDLRGEAVRLGTVGRRWMDLTGLCAGTNLGRVTIANLLRFIFISLSLTQYAPNCLDNRKCIKMDLKMFDYCVQKMPTNTFV